MAHRESKYVLLKDAGSDVESETLQHEHSSRSRSALLQTLPWITHLLVLSIYSTLFIIATKNGCSSSPRSMEEGPQYTQEYGQAVEELGHKHPIQLVGEFGAPSIWRGAPNAAIDAAWENITNVGAMSVPKEEIERLGKLRNSTVTLSQESGGGYMASIGAFHQVHCLNLLRKYSYLDYYAAREPDFFGDPVTRVHVDHCVEMLRQVLMCSADLHLISYDWVEQVDFPWPDFSTDHMCRDYPAVHAWGREHAARTVEKGGILTKPVGVALRPVPQVEY